MPPWLIVTGLLAVVAAVAWGAWGLWQTLEGTDIDPLGQIALVAGGGLALLMTVGFMVLIYISRTRGFDEAAGHGDAEPLDDEVR